MNVLSKIKWVFLSIMGTLLLANIIFPPPLDRAYDTSTLVTDRHGLWLTAFTVDNGRWRLKADMDEVDPRFVAALIAIEDKRFYRHSGVDPLAVLRAARSWRRQGEIVSGASTLTMQLVRQLEPRPLSAQTVWQPDKPGFYKVSVVDSQGATTSSHVRVMAVQ